MNFSSGTLPADEVLTQARLELTTVNLGDPTPVSYTAHRVTAAWTELGVTWANISTGYLATPVASATVVPGGVVSFDITALVKQWLNGTAVPYGVLVRSSTTALSQTRSREEPNTLLTPRLVATTALVPVFTSSTSTMIESDPVNGTTNPKRIPGALLRSSALVSNSGRGTADSGSVTASINIDARTRLYVGDLALAGSGPIGFTQGANPSGVTLTYGGLASTTDDVEFSSDGTTWTYTPVPAADGYDAAVKKVRLLPKGVFAGASAAGATSFTADLRVRAN